MSQRTERFANSVQQELVELIRARWLAAGVTERE